MRDSSSGVLTADEARLPAGVPEDVARLVYLGRALSVGEFVRAIGEARSTTTVLRLIREGVIPTISRGRPHLLSPSLVWDFYAGRLRL